ncbi:MAG TPA: NmrA/HSCARG family protein [Nitrososphaeraceae archaeon]|nr:NmrA/HSCARG family protein [Nitrososphaeraceae archaeon]
MVVNQRKILVTGATGQQGGSLARLLLQKKHKVYALTRNAQSPAAQDLRNKGANIVKGDLDDPNSLQHAVKDVESIFLMGTPFEDGTEGETRRGQLVADIAKENGIEHLVYSSVANADKNTGIPHFESKYKVEQHIKSLGIPYTIIGPTFFMENLLGPGLEQGQLALPLSSSSVLQQSALQNIAEFSALVLEGREPFLGKRIDIASDEVTGQQAAEILSNELGYKIKYVPIPLEQVYQANEDMARMYEWYEKVGTGIDITSLHQEYPKVNWLTFKDWARSKLR